VQISGGGGGWTDMAYEGTVFIGNEYGQKILIFLEIVCFGHSFMHCLFVGLPMQEMDCRDPSIRFFLLKGLNNGWAFLCKIFGDAALIDRRLCYICWTSQLHASINKVTSKTAEIEVTDDTQMQVMYSLTPQIITTYQQVALHTITAVKSWE